ncbi:hypothetical protein V3595_01435 [Bacillus sp. CFBP9009]
MFTGKLIREYKKIFGFKANVKECIKSDRLTILYIVLCLIFTYLLGTFIDKQNYLLIFIFLIFDIFAFLIFYFHRKNLILKKYGSLYGFQQHKINIFKDILKDNFNIDSSEGLKQLDEIVKKEISILEDMKKFPFSEWIRPLITALLITGLLGLGIQQFLKGNDVQAGKLVMLYFLIIGVTIFISFFISMCDSRITYLKKISFQLSELILLKELELESREKKKQLKS